MRFQSPGPEFMLERLFCLSLNVSAQAPNEEETQCNLPKEQKSCFSGKSKWGLSNGGLRPLSAICAQSSTIVHFCGFSGPLSKGIFRHKMTTIVGNRGQLWTSALSPHLQSPHLDFPEFFNTVDKGGRIAESAVSTRLPTLSDQCSLLPRPVFKYLCKQDVSPDALSSFFLTSLSPSCWYKFSCRCLLGILR